MVIQHLRHLDLPHLNKQRWQKLKDLYSELNGIQTANNLTELLERLFIAAGNDIDVHIRDRSTAKVLNSNSAGSGWCFEGLGIFLEEIATHEEKETFFNIVLPFIVTLASSIDEFSPREGILVCLQQRECGITLDRKFIACVLASAFLCSLPPSPEDTQVQSINFVNFFACFHREEIQQTQASKLQCLIHYFERISNDWPDIEGRVLYNRQVIPSPSLPTLEDWMSCNLPLCPVIVDNKTSIEDSGEHMLQVDFANRFIGGGVLGAGHVQEEIRFCINPELLVALMFMEAMQDNECIVVRGVERFSSYSGYGKTFQFAGDYKDESQRDKDGNFLTSVVAIDATPFKTSPIEAQFEEFALIRELNKALVGFYNPDVGSQIIHSSSESKQYATESEDQSIENTIEALPMPPLTTVETQEFSDNLVNLALTQAFNEVDSNNNTAPEDVVDAGDILTPIMKKSLIEVFGSMPDKARAYSENFLSPPPLPKCVTRTISGSNTPVVPGTPPSSPAVFDLEQKPFDSNGFQTYLSSPGSLPLKSFADSLSNSLMSCVELTSSLATAIATTASSPVLAAAGTKESFQKSLGYLGSPVKNGDNLISFLSQQVSKSDTPLSKKYSNGFSISEFVEDLSSLVNASKCKRYEDNTDSYVQSPNARQNLLEEFNVEECEGRKMEELKDGEGVDTSNAANAKLFEKFATELSRSVLDSAISCSFCSREEESEMAVEEDEAAESVPSDVLTGRSSREDACQRAEDTENSDLRNIVKGHVEPLVLKIISAALAEAAEQCDGKTTVLMSCAENDDGKESGNSDSLSQSELEVNNRSEIQASVESNTSSSESSEEEQGDQNEGVKMTSENGFSELSSTSEAAVQTAGKLAEKIMFDALAHASEMMQGEEMEAMDEGERYTQGETQLELEDVLAEESSFSDDEISEEETLQSFAEHFSSLTVRGAVNIAEACLEESRVHPVATGNWGCGVFRGDPELKAVIQWVAASAAGCPVVVYHTFGDRRLSRLLKTLVCLHSRGWKISDVIQGVLRFCESAREERDGTVGHQTLLAFLCLTPQTSL